MFGLTGCTLRFHQEYTFTDETTFDIEAIVAADEEMREFIESEGGNFMDEVSTSYEDEVLPEGVDYNSEPYVDGEFEGAKITVRNLTATTDDVDDIFSVDANGVWSLSADFTSGFDDETNPKDFEDLPFDFDDIYDFSLIINNVEVIETNGSVSGNTVKFGNEMLTEEPVLVFKPNLDGADGSGVAVSALSWTLLAIIVMGGLAIFFLTRKL